MSGHRQAPVGAAIAIVCGEPIMIQFKSSVE